MKAGEPLNRRTVACPQCNRPAALDAGNSWRPFCCERCKLIDLGAWSSERYTIATDDPALDGNTQDDSLQ